MNLPLCLSERELTQGMNLWTQLYILIKFLVLLVEDEDVKDEEVV